MKGRWTWKQRAKHNIRCRLILRNVHQALSCVKMPGDWAIKEQQRKKLYWKLCRFAWHLPGIPVDHSCQGLRLGWMTFVIHSSRNFTKSYCIQQEAKSFPITIKWIGNCLLLWTARDSASPFTVCCFCRSWTKVRYALNDDWWWWTRTVPSSRLVFLMARTAATSDVIIHGVLVVLSDLQVIRFALWCSSKIT